MKSTLFSPQGVWFTLSSEIFFFFNLLLGRKSFALKEALIEAILLPSDGLILGCSRQLWTFCKAHMVATQKKGKVILGNLKPFSHLLFGGHEDSLGMHYQKRPCFINFEHLLWGVAINRNFLQNSVITLQRQH